MALRGCVAFGKNTPSAAIPGEGAFRRFILWPKAQTPNRESLSVCYDNYLLPLLLLAISLLVKSLLRWSLVVITCSVNAQLTMSQKVDCPYHLKHSYPGP